MSKKNFPMPIARAQGSFFLLFRQKRDVDHDDRRAHFGWLIGKDMIIIFKLIHDGLKKYCSRSAAITLAFSSPSPSFKD